jgi:thioredoxin-like negative regulator of GroEL
MIEGTLQGIKAWPERAVDLSEDEMKSFLHRYDLVMVDCWVGWCKHSKKMVPLFEGLTKELAGMAAFGKLDAQRTSMCPSSTK